MHTICSPALQAHSSKTICIVRLRISSQKLVLISCRVARTYVTVSDRRVSYAPHDWRNYWLCVTVGSDMSKFTEGSWQGSFTVNNERTVRTLKPSTEQKKCFERIPSRPEFPCKFADWFSSVFQSLQMHCRVFCNLAGNHDIHGPQKTIHTCRHPGPGISEKTKETKVILPASQTL